MSRISAITLAAFAALAASPAGASAATWSPPVDVSSAATFIDDPFMGFGSTGRGIAAWRWTQGVGETSSGGERVASKVFRGGPFEFERRAPGAIVPPVVYGRERVVFLDMPTTYTGGRAHARVRATFGRTNGRFERTKTLDTIEPAFQPALAANDEGHVAVAYIQRLRSDTRRSVTLVERRPGGTFGRPRVIVGRGRANAVTVAVGPEGDLVVAWEREGRVEARVRYRGGSLGPILRVGTAAKGDTALRSEVSERGRVWVAWTAQPVSEGGENGRFSARLAFRGRGTRAFRPALLLDSFLRRVSDEARFDLELDRDGRAFVAWTSMDSFRHRARLAVADPSGHLRSNDDVSTPGYAAVVHDVATSRRGGEALVVWAALDRVGELGDQIVAAYRSPRGVVTEELVTRGPKARLPMAAFDPLTGSPTVVWSQRVGPDGPGVPISQVRTFVRASTRTP